MPLFERPSFPEAVEQVLWSLALLSVIMMIVVMPWVGDDKLIPGTAWIGYSTFSIVAFSSLAGLMHLAFGDFGRTVDDDLDRRFRS